MDEVNVWQSFLSQINDKVSSLSFNTWFKGLKLLKISDNEIIIADPGKTIKDQLTIYYKDLIDETLIEITGKSYKMIFKDENMYEPPEIISVNNISVVNTLEIDKKKINDYKSNLNPKYTFDNFVVGESNRYAFSSSLAVAQNPGKLYNPLFIYGKSGLGKTHLMHAIGNYITENSNLKVLYTDADTFMNEFVKMTRDTGDKDQNLSYIELFKNKYRDIDVLMIDEIQFLGSATATQQEFTNTFNSLYYNDKQIIICSDRSVNDLKMFEERLRTRFNWGLKAIINVPEYELKVKIIKNKMKNIDSMMDLSDDIIDFIASNCGSDVRNLEGSITRLQAYAAIMNIKNLKLEDAIEALDEYANGRGTFTDNSIGKIMSIVANYFNLSIDDLTGKRRSKEIANARMIAMYLCKLLTEETLERIGLEFGGRDHSTVIHACEKIGDDVKTNGELEKIISELKVKMSE